MERRERGLPGIILGGTLNIYSRGAETLQTSTENHYLSVRKMMGLMEQLKSHRLFFSSRRITEKNNKKHNDCANKAGEVVVVVVVLVVVGRLGIHRVPPGLCSDANSLDFSLVGRRV